MDRHPTGGAGFDGYLLTYLVDRPEDVRTVRCGGTEVLKPARKALFGSCSGVHRSPDGALWKVAARFYADLGFTADRRYGSKYAAEGLTLEVSTADPEALLQRAGSAGAGAVDGAGFTDPEGFRWRVVAA